MRCEPVFVREQARNLRGSRAARWGRQAARDGEPRFRARDPHVRRRPIVARHEGVRTKRPVLAALTGFFSGLATSQQRKNGEKAVAGRSEVV